jgi:hypothetical protein
MPRLEYDRDDIRVVFPPPHAGMPPLARPTDQRVERYTIGTGNREAVEFPWESYLPPGGAIVFSSPVRPRIADILPAFPLRVLATDPAARDYVLRMNQEMIETEAVIPAASPLLDFESFLRSNEWPTADILHISEPLSDRPLRTSLDAPPGTAGWLLRIADLWQTRLIILEHDGVASVPLRRVAAAIVDRGGPGVLLVPRGRYGDVYWSFVHDRPLDWICASFGFVLFAGAGREELLRYSKIPELLARRDVVTEMAEPLAKKLKRSGVQVLEELLNASDAVRDAWQTIEFHMSEGGGLNPAKVAIDIAFEVTRTRRKKREGRNPVEIRDEAPAGPGAEPRERGPAAAAAATRGESRAAPKPKPEPETRYVNSAFFREAGDDVEGVAQDAVLPPCEIVQLGIQIGPLDTIVKTAGHMALVEEKFLWREQKASGVRVDVAVSGIDFEVHGSPVQSVWLPRTGRTDRVFFAVSPSLTTTIPGVARLRFSIFYQNNIVQSFRVAALTATSSDGRHLLAAALDLEVPRIPADVAWTSTVEYANTSLADVKKLPRRGLTIIANESAGEKVYTVKGEELFHVTINNDVPNLITDLRTTLRTLSAESASPTRYRYRFGKVDNAGDPAQLEATLFTIANLGWQLYSAIVNDAADREEVDRILGSREEIIHVADVKLGDIVPWSLLYDREIDPSRKTRRDAAGVSHAAERKLCHAGWPDADGNLKVKECGGPDCVLSKGLPGVGVDTVVCPLRFWGYKHQIEVPVQQVTERAAAEVPAAAPPKRDRPVKIAVAINRKLPLAKEHEDRFTQLLQRHATAAALEGAIVDDRDTLKDTLRDGQPDIVYLYCHAFARNQFADGTISGPNLGFGDETDESALIAAPNLTGAAWKRAPLVFLNGCSTVGFNPCAPSRFVVQFVRTRRAGALIGTEVTVWEILAAEMAETFLDAFLANATAGDALRRARRLLLLKNNPLGLVYTLYGKAELTL